MKNGRPYYYVREMARINGQPKVVKQVYLGSPERILELVSGKESECTRISAEEFGSLWMAHLIDSQVGLVPLVDSVIPRGKSETGPTVGEYFLYAVFNHMVDATSKRALPDWYAGTAIQVIRPVAIEELNSERYCRKWDRVKEEDLEKIASLFFSRIKDIEKPESGCFLFDTTNYYTYMASDTPSELAKRGKNKEGRDWLRQVGVALLVARDSQLPLFYREYEGNRHDSKLFGRILSEVVSSMKNACPKDLTVVFDKGMNSEGNIEAIDGMPGVHFITSYSPHYAEEYLKVKLSEFSPVDTPKNRELERRGKEDDRILALRTSGEFWGKARTVILTYNPLTATKQRYGFEKKLLEVQATLFELRSKLQHSAKWKGKIEKHYRDLCERLHLPEDLYEISIEGKNGGWTLLFRKNHYRIGRHIERFGKNILITDHDDWSTDEIVRASLDRYMVEKAFRQSKDDDLAAILPLRHWTDGKIRCHILTCVIALTYLRLLELRLGRAGVQLSAAKAMTEMQRLHSCLCWVKGKRDPSRIVEEPTEAQGQILSALGYEVTGGVLQKIKS